MGLTVITVVLLFHCCLVWLCDGKFNISVVRTEEKVYHLLYDFKVNKTCRLIPDEVSVSELGYNPSEVRVISNEDLKQYIVGAPVPSLIKAAINPDEVLRVAIQRAKAMNPIKFKTIIQKYGYFNPSIALWNGRVIMAWAMASGHKGDPLDPNVAHKGEIRFAWLKEGSYSEISTETIYGIGPEFFLTPTDPKTKFFEDARLMVMKNNSLFISYAAVDIYGGISFRKVILTINKDTQKVEMGGSIVAFNEKNWITFEYPENKVYYIRSVNPIHISEVVIQENGNEAVTNVVQLSKIELPWNHVYIEHVFRGSTPAIMVNGVYFAFFHTRAIIQANSKRFTYFMGAISFCPHYPFHVHSISNYPILEPSWYDGPWLVTFYDYIVYPAGILLSADNKTIYMSSGYQMRDMQIFEFDVEELFDSMEIVNQCSDKPLAPVASFV